MISFLFQPDMPRRSRGAACTFVRVYESGSPHATPVAFLSRFRKTRRSKWGVSVSLANNHGKPIPEFREWVRALCDAAESYEWPNDYA